MADAEKITQEAGAEVAAIGTDIAVLTAAAAAAGPPPPPPLQQQQQQPSPPPPPAAVPRRRPGALAAAAAAIPADWPWWAGMAVWIVFCATAPPPASAPPPTPSLPKADARAARRGGQERGWRWNREWELL